MLIESKLCSAIVSDEQMQTKIGNSILLAQPRCIAAGCSPANEKLNRISEESNCFSSLINKNVTTLQSHGYILTVW